MNGKVVVGGMRRRRTPTFGGGPTPSTGTFFMFREMDVSDRNSLTFSVCA